MNQTPALPTKPRRTWRRRLFITAAVLGLLVFLLFNVMTFAEAWGMTHYRSVNARTTRVAELNTWSRLRFLFTGPVIRRMENTNTPASIGLAYTTQEIRNARGQKLETWCIPAKGQGPLVLLFPGYTLSKDTLLATAVEFHRMGCETWLTDFSGIGGSEGRTTTIGWREAEDVIAVMAAARKAAPNRRVVLYGTSMGAAAVLRAAHLGSAAPDALIIECPFDRLVGAIGRRCELAGVPRTPFARGVAFWAGVQHGFNAFKHNPESFARDVRCPTLLMQGGKDQYVALDCARRIAGALGANGTLQVFPDAGHSNLAIKAPAPWRESVQQFLKQKLAPPPGPPVARIASHSEPAQVARFKF